MTEEAEDFDAQLTDAIRTKLAKEAPDWLKTAVEELQDARRREVIPHPLGGFIIIGKKRLHRFDPTYLEDSEPAESFRGRAVTLRDHSAGVAQHAHRFAAACGLDQNLYRQAGLWHDIGKLDPRFQAMLRQSSPRTAVGEPLAKSAQCPRTREERDQARQVHRYPARARHELLSAALVSTKTDDDLLLHLIATHHGSGRPFASPVEENEAAKKPFGAKLLGETFQLETSGQDVCTWNVVLPERFWRIVRRYGWWGAAYRETVFRLADHAQSRVEQERDWKAEGIENAVIAADQKTPRRELCALPLPGLDGSNPLAYLAALGTFAICEQLSHTQTPPVWLTGPIALGWGLENVSQMPVLYLPVASPTPEEFTSYLAEHLPRTTDNHPMKWIVRVLSRKNGDLAGSIRAQCMFREEEERPYLDWVIALACETVPEAASQLQTVRRDYLLGNIRQIMKVTEAIHLERSLFQPWDFRDPLANQSLHWEPSEDRRHAYQWHMPSGDPTRKSQGGMLGANRLALEAWPFFPSFPAGGSANERIATRGFKGNRANDTYFSWPLWERPLGTDGVVSVLALEMLQSEEPTVKVCRQYNVSRIFRAQRILVEKTPNFTTAKAIA